MQPSAGRRIVRARLLEAGAHALVRGLQALLVSGTCAMSAGASPLFGSADPFKTETKVAPMPNRPWEPVQPLPAVPAPPLVGAPIPATALTLAELTEYALRNNPRARQAWFAARAAAAGVGVEQADLLPQVAGTFAMSRNLPVSATTGAVSPWISRYGPAISITYLLFDFGAREDQINSAEYRLLAANLNQNRVLQDIIFQVEQAYYRLLGLSALIQVNQSALQNLNTVLDAARRRRESGLATVADVYRAETQVAQAELNLARSRGELQKARGQLAVTAGVPVDGVLNVQTMSQPPQIGEVTASLTDLLDRAKASRPDLVAAEAQARSARAAASAAAKAGLPSVEITGGTGYTLFNDDRPNARNYSLGLNVRIPIFSGFRDTYVRRQADAVAAQAEAARDSLYRQTELDVWQAYYDVQTAASTIGSSDVQVRSAEQTVEATLARYQAGFGSILDLITAQQDESNAKVQRIQSYLDWFTALARLTFSAGVNEIMVGTSDKR